MKRPKGLGSIYTRPDSPLLWMKYSRYGKAYRESTGTTDRRKAEMKLKRRLGEIAIGTFAGPEADRMRVEELAGQLFEEYGKNGRKSLSDVKARWTLHLQPFFLKMRAMDVTSALVDRYITGRQEEGAKNATVNRELAALKRMFRLGQRDIPTLRIPICKPLKENNVRKGFLQDAQLHLLIQDAELWFRSLVECGRTYGWRVSELLQMRVNQIDLAQGVIRLDPGTTKNNDGREVFMTDSVRMLLAECVQGKAPDAPVFTRANGKGVRAFRVTWQRACTRAGVGKTTCAECSSPMDTGAMCPNCKSDRSVYSGLIFHDLRRTAARNLRRAGVPETIIMKIGGWRTRSVFERYAIVSRTDIAEAMQKLQQNERETAISHELVTLPAVEASRLPGLSQESVQ